MSKQYPLVRMADSSHAVGQFGRFEVLDELGRGAMGVVYRARDPLINRIVAIKTVSLGNQPPDTQSEYRERFRREAEAAGRLSHPGIVTVFDVGEELETRAPFIVMEYVEGYSLERSSKLTYQTVVRLIRDLAEAIDYAHAQNIVHRDLKPSNILVSEDGHAKIADFGVAKLNRSELTACGHILGTPAFMSPEQLNGGPIDGRSDIFSLGVILYTLLTGHRPFQGNSPLTVSFKVVHHEPVPATALNLTLPSEINQIVVRAMAKDPADRYQRGIDMAADLQNVLEHQLPKDESNRTGSSITDTGVHTEHVHTATSKIDQRLVTERQQMLTHIGSRLQKKWRRHGFWLLASILALCALALREPLRRLPQTASIEPSPMGPAVTDSSKPKTVLNPSVTIDHPAQYPLKTPSAVLQISVEPKFDQAKLTVWIDDHTVLRRNLTAVEKKTFRLIGGSRPTKLPNVYLAPGNHHVRVRLQSSAGLYDESHTVKAIFPEHSQRVLTVSFGKKKEMKVTLK